MNRYRPVFLLFIASLSGAAGAGTEPVAADRIIAFFDSARAGSMGSETVIRLRAASGGNAGERRFRVLDDGAQSSLVEFLDPLQRGQKVLATGSDLWFFSPRTRRAIKIPPLQRLFGEASYGDIARLRLSTDYVPVGPAKLIPERGQLQSMLRAKAPGATYSKVTLTVRQSDLVPVKADYFVASGKHLRTVEFVDATRTGERLRNDHWRIYAPDAPKRVTDVVVERAQPRTLPPAMFTRRALEES